MILLGIALRLLERFWPTELPGSFKVSEDPPVCYTHPSEVILRVTGGPIDFPKKPADLQDFQIAFRPFQKLFVSGAKRQEKLLVSGIPDRFQKIEHTHRDIMKPIPPDRVFEVEGAQFAVIYLAILMPKIAMDHAQIVAGKVAVLLFDPLARG